MNPTIHEVAKRASVSISTVSRVVNNPDSVRKDKRERVLAVIEELGYTPNPFASGLRDKRTMTIVAVIPDISNPFYSELFRGIEDVARDHGNNVIICNTDEREERFLEYMRFFKKKKPDGLIFASAPITEVFDKSFKELDLPVVLAATESGDVNFPFVKVHDYQASVDATTFLIKNGHCDIGFISGPLGDPIAGKPRYDGFCAAMEAFQLPVTETHVVEGDFHFDAGYQAMATLYAKLPEVTAVFAASDAMALGAMKFLQERAIEVPRQVSIIGYDNLAISRMVSPGLTTVSQSIYDIGRQAAHLLMEWIVDGDRPASKILPHQIVIRESVRNLR